MKKPINQKFTSLLGLLCTVILLSCERDFDVKLSSGKPMLVVEAYINNLMPEYNYVILSRSQDYYSPDFRSLIVAGARVSITEGELATDRRSYVWDPASKVTLSETTDPRIPDSLRQGLYFDPRILTNPSQALKGQTGKYYLLEIEADGNTYSAVTGLLQPVTLDSITSGYHFIDAEDENKLKARITAHYQDPDTIGNTQMYYWRYYSNRGNFGWASLGRNRRARGDDDLTNGQYIQLTQNQEFEVGDTVEYFLVSAERKVYNFWESFDKARDNEGPFSTPVTLMNTINGENVVGCFSGFSISMKKDIVR
ncbi:DUF4249 domain-containing protein [Terrimonas sp. NA20]|uniref:DUF4249 domain-containing protein n=1 Tax=Terrimonas ginsenosidimutans TaxID=2908004 RepID=A0ABS9KYU2_9BACT|nr:DUF4249 domain-containing protein [Terrimonas ginsenosidimutans]MCG2617509.1 DUF4249 domain-containing protein [Terrimonas ginsenosidimutans]